MNQAKLVFELLIY